MCLDTLLIILMFYTQVPSGNSWVTLDENRLEAQERVRQKLLANYSADIPAYAVAHKDEEETYSIGVGLFVNKILDLNEASEQLTVSVQIQVEWMDARLRWFPGGDDPGALDFTLKQIWTPYMILYNSATTLPAILDEKSRVKVYQMGAAIWQGILTLTVPCDMDVTNFPVDNQVCSLVFRIMPDGQRLEGAMEMHRRKEFVYYDDNLWDFNNSKNMNISEIVVGEPPIQFKDLVFELTLHRKHWYYMTKILIPISMLSVLVLCVFFIPPDAGEKVSLGVTLLLTFSVFQTIIDTDLPSTSNSTPRFTTFMILLQICSVFSIIASVFVLNVHHLGPEYGGRMPKWVRFLFFNILAKLTCYRSCGTRMKANDKKVGPSCDESKEMTGGYKNEAHEIRGYENEIAATTEPVNISDTESFEEEWKLGALILDMCLMYVCLVSMAIVYTHLVIALKF